MAFKVARETRKGWDCYKLNGYDRFLAGRDMLNERPWLGRRHVARLCNTSRWADRFRWDRTSMGFEEV